MANRKTTILKGSRIPDWAQNPTGLLKGTGPYIGIVKWNSDPARSGRLKVYIPALGSADPDDASHWFTVKYASPFRGKTQGKVGNLNEYIQMGDYAAASEEEENSFQSYGMWMVPPDIGVRVLCVFLDAEPDKGYWFACINDSYDSFMTPGIGSADSGVYIWNPGKYQTHKKLQDYIELASKEVPSRMPVSEPTYGDQTKDDGTPLSNLDAIKKFPHVYQNMMLGIQGLCFDFTRGCVSSSSVRESPSQVFGITTPGRYWMMPDEPKSRAYVSGGDPDQLLKNFRTGGHQFVMDDGTTEGLDQFIRIRSTKGNMVLLDDTNEQIYIVNARGTAWIEMTPTGRIDIYTDSDFSLRSKGDINIHTEKDFNLHVRGKIRMRSEETTNIESVGNYTLRSESNSTFYSRGKMELGTASNQNLYSAAGTSIKSGGTIVMRGGPQVTINTDGGVQVQEPNPIPQKKHPKTQQEPGKKTWWMRGDFESIVARAPEHEPWKNHEKFTVKAVSPTTSEGKKISR